MPPNSVGHRLGSRLRVWVASVRAGLASIPRDPLLGLRRSYAPLNYWRSAEFAYVWDRLRLPPGALILDVGSPKTLAIALARSRGHRVVAVDIRGSEVRQADRLSRAQGSSGVRPGRVDCQIQDGRILAFRDDTFDAAYSVSVLEHIPDDGDSLALRELGRVVKPGGRIALTVPYDSEARETWVGRSVYERRQLDREAVFYQRHYDGRTLHERLVAATSRRLEHVEYWGEGRVRVERLLRRAGAAALPLAPLEPLLSLLFLKCCGETDGCRPMAAFLTLSSPSSRDAEALPMKRDVR